VSRRRFIGDYGDGGGWLAEDDVSTATTGWGTSTDSWQSATLDSTDTSGPNDADLEFGAKIRYRTLTLVPLGYEK